VSASASKAAAPALSCQVTRLPTDGAKKALVTGGDPSGRYLGDRPGRPLVWRCS